MKTYNKIFEIRQIENERITNVKQILQIYNSCKKNTFFNTVQISLIFSSTFLLLQIEILNIP